MKRFPLKKLFFILLIIMLISVGSISAQEIIQEQTIDAKISRFGIDVLINRPEYWTDFMPPGWRPPQIIMGFRVFNFTDIPVTFNFTSSQRFDFIIYNSSGTEVWRWSDGKYFLMVFGTMTLNPGEKRFYTYRHQFVDKNGNPMPEDTYTLKGKLVSQETMEGEITFKHYYVY